MREIVARVERVTRENERLFQELVAGERRFRGLSKAVWRVQEEERRRLARELHDGIGQTLTALKNQLELLEREAAGSGPAPADRPALALRPRLAEAVGIAALALRETRELSRLLRPPVLDDLGLVPALRWLARSLRERTGLEVRLVEEGLDERLEPDLETLVFRVVQEALNNVVKHAGVAAAEVALGRRGGSLRLRVADAGRGFDPERLPEEAGVGLRGVRDRVELFGGHLQVRSAPGGGTTLDIEVPVGEEDKPAPR
jgi:signal transduction histidine kinase